MQFPDKVYVSFTEEESYPEGGFLSINDAPEDAIEGDGPTRVAVYVLQEVQQGVKSTTFSLTEAIDKEVLAPSA